jgi:hypothetical protein
MKCHKVKTIPRLEQLREIEGPPPLEVPRKDIFMLRAMTVESKICIRSDPFLYSRKRQLPEVER